MCSPRPGLPAFAASQLLRRLSAQQRRYRADWRGRMAPSVCREAWRGRVRPRQADLGPAQVGVAPAPCVTLARGARSLGLARLHGRWLAFLPLRVGPPGGGARFAYPGGTPPWVGADTTLGAPERPRAWFFALARSLGGLANLKLRYKGKSFRWHRRLGALVLRFGHSHLVACRFLPGLRWRRFGRMKLLLFGTSACELRHAAQRVCAWRTPNIYHSRGLRLARQRLYRKGGKVSAYR